MQQTDHPTTSTETPNIDELAELTEAAKQAASVRKAHMQQMTKHQLEYVYQQFRKALRAKKMKIPSRTEFKGLLVILGLPPDISDSAKVAQHVIDTYFELLRGLKTATEDEDLGPMLPNVKRLTDMQTGQD